MKFLWSIGAITSLVLVATGLFWLWKLGFLGSGLSSCILGIICGSYLSMALYAFRLRERLASLENCVRKLK
jgi:hypothetical protein